MGRCPHVRLRLHRPFLNVSSCSVFIRGGQVLSEAGTVSILGPSENSQHDLVPKRRVNFLCVALPVPDVNTPPKTYLFSLLGSAHSQRWSPAVHPALGPDGHQRPDEGSRRGGAAAAREWVRRWRWRRGPGGGAAYPAVLSTVPAF